MTGVKVGVRSKEVVDLLLAEVAVNVGEGETKYPSDTYEQGVLATLRWLTDQIEDHPLEGEDDGVPTRD